MSNGGYETSDELLEDIAKIVDMTTSKEQLKDTLKEINDTLKENK